MPAPATGLVADWNPASIVGLVDGDPCDSLTEDIGAKHAVSTSTERPLYKTDGPNGKPYLRFDGVNDFVRSPAFAAVAQPYTVFLVLRPQRWTTGNRPFDGNNVNNSVINQYPADLVLERGLQSYSIYSGSAFTPTNAGGALTSSGGHFGIIRALFNGASSALAINGNTPAVANSGSNAFTGVTIGAAGNNILPAQVDVLRCLVYNSSIVSAAAVEAYLTTEYALVVPNLFVCDGDSLTEGYGATGHIPATAHVAGSYPSQLLVLLGSAWAKVNIGVSGQTVVQMQADAATHVDGQLNTLSQHKVLCAWGGTNDMAIGGSDGATAYADYVTYCTARRSAGWKVVAFTVLPRSATGISANFPTDRAAFNALVRANWATFADALADVAGDSRIGDDGDNTDATYYTDNIHLNDTGYGIVAAMGKTAIDSITAASPVRKTLSIAYMRG